MRRHAPRTRTRAGSLLASLALAVTLLHAPAAHADPFAGISSIWSLLAPRAKVTTQISDVYRKRPLQQPEARLASGSPARAVPTTTARQ
jgi:hypothetical protein